MALLRPSPLRAFVLSVCATGAAVLVAAALLTRPQETADRWAVLALLAALVLVGELLPIVVPRDDGQEDEITVSTTFALALTLVGPLALAVAVQALAVALEDLRDRKDASKVLFNVAQYVLTLTACRAVFCLLTGQPLLSGQPLEIPGDLPAALAAGVTFFLVNNALVGTVIALDQRAPVREQIVDDVRSQAAMSGVLICFAPVVAVALDLSLWLTPLLVLPIAAVHHSARMAAAHEREAMHDTLTGLPNRVLFRMRIDRAIEEADRTDSRFGVVLVDLDHFKEINDTLGHQVGDDLLVQVSERISRNLRPGDTVARLGGDEFAILTASPTDALEAVLLAERLLEALEPSFTADDVRLDVQASFGVAVYRDHGHDVDTLLQRADIAMYRAKEQRGTVRMYEAARDDHNPERLALAAELRSGLRSGEVFVAFQPKVDAATGRTAGLEALVRWQHPKYGVLLPDEFLPVVENTGLMAPLTMAVLDQSVGALAQWRAAGHTVSVSVNLSVRHLMDLNLPQHVDRVLRKHGVPAQALTVEVTETVLMTDPSRAVLVVGALRALGVSVAIDDFGTGYSSLSYLRRLQVNELKIDKTFVIGMGVDEGDAVIVRSTIDMGHNLGLRIVAEGVEDHGTLAVLRDLRCDVVQGYGLCRPLLAEQVLPWLTERARQGVAAADWWVSASTVTPQQVAVPASRTSIDLTGDPC